MVTTMLVATEYNITFLDSFVVLALFTINFKGTFVGSFLDTFHALFLVDGTIGLVFAFFSSTHRLSNPLRFPF